MRNQPTNIEVRLPEDLQGGAYANNLLVQHTQEEFILDFMMITQQTGIVTSRVIVSPGHMKRLLSALQDNLGKYEQAYGTLAESKGTEFQVGFHPQIVK